MLPWIIATFVTITGSLYYIRKRRRDELEARQLQMFIEQVVWDADNKKYVVYERDEILDLPDFFEK